jgi:hypothetical protein
LSIFLWVVTNKCSSLWYRAIKFETNKVNITKQI